MSLLARRGMDRIPPAGGGGAASIDIVWHLSTDTPYPEPIGGNTGINIYQSNTNPTLSNMVDQDNVGSGLGFSRTGGSPSQQALTVPAGSDNGRWSADMSEYYDYTGSNVTYTITGFDANEVVDLDILCSFRTAGRTMHILIEGVDETGIFACSNNTASQLLTGMQADGSGEMTIQIVFDAGNAVINCLGIDRS